MEEGQEVLEREQRREKQELQDKVMVIKNGVPKGDKKKKKEANAQIAKLEGDLNEKHSAELMDLLLNAVSISDEAEVAPVENGNEDEKDAEEAGGKAGEPRVSKAQKRREKKAEKEEQRRREIEEQEEANLVGARHGEQQTIARLLAGRGLQLEEVPSDGDCMFAAIRHQLAAEGGADPCPPTIVTLRERTAGELRRGQAGYRPFLSHPRTGEMLTDEEFSQYCDTMAGTPAWGGQVELLALATVLGRPLTVVQAEGQQAVTVGQELPGPALVLAYHRLVFGLGEHYNSVRPAD